MQRFQVAFGFSVLLAAGTLSAADAPTCRITVDAKSVLREINPLFFGVNTLFWIEDDASFQDGKLAAQLREMPCRLMRFPGGEVADNYHWKTKKLDDLKQFPASEGPDKLDCDKFMVLCRQVGAEPIFVVNLESGFIHGSLEAAVAEAADWVRYANKEKGYNIRYWEIGNETYLPASRYPAKARQYAAAAAKFSRAMKAVDPGIKIGFVGPIEGEGETVTPMDRLTDAELEECRKIPGHARREAIKQKAAGKTGGDFDAWWPTVLKLAAADMDFAIVHRYQPNRFGPDVNSVKPISGLKQFLAREIPGRKIPIALTEWNSGRNISSSMASALVVAELIGDYVAAGVDMACLWPMRYPGGESLRSLFDTKTNDPKPAYAVMKLYSSNMGAGSKLVAATATQKTVYTRASLSGDGRRLAVFLINKSPAKEGVATRISLEGFDGKTVQAAALAGGNLKITNSALQKTAVEYQAGGVSLTLPPNSLTVVTCE